MYLYLLFGHSGPFDVFRVILSFGYITFNCYELMIQYWLYLYPDMRLPGFGENYLREAVCNHREIVGKCKTIFIKKLFN